MEVQKIGPNSVMIRVDAAALRPSDRPASGQPYDQNTIEKIAREALLTEGIRVDGSLELEAYAIGDQAIVFAVSAERPEAAAMYGFGRLDDAMDAASELCRLQDPPDAAFLYHGGTYYMALFSKPCEEAALLLSEYAFPGPADPERRREMMDSAHMLIDSRAFGVLAGREEQGRV